MKLCFSTSSKDPEDSAWRKELCRLKWNWLYVLLLSSLGTINTSSPLGTLHQFVTNPPDGQVQSASFSAYEPGLGGSESLYAWSISINNIGGFLGAVLGAVFSNVLPYWYGFLISLICHIVGFLFYGLARYGWMIILSRLLTGIFTGLQRALAFAYFGVSYQHYVDTLQNAGIKESTKFCRVKDVLFSLYTVTTSVGLLIGAGFSAIIARIHHIDYFRAVGWYNMAFGILSLVLLPMFRGEFAWKKHEHLIKYLQQVKNMGAHCKQKLNISTITKLIFLITCTAVIKSRISVYEELFNPFLSDSFGFSEDVTVYFFLMILIAPVLGGVLLLLLEWTRMTNLMISIIGILATILGLFLMTDWQTIPHDPCLKYSLFHHPELLTNYSIITQGSGILQTGDYCWDLYNETGEGNQRLSFNGRLQVVMNPQIESPLIETIECKLDISHHSCLTCQKATSSQVSFLFSMESHTICYEPNRNHMDDANEEPGSLVSVLCTFQNSSCISLCFQLQDNDTFAKIESIGSSLLKQTSKSVVKVAYQQSLHILEDNQYHVARNVCESHEADDCHWIPDSFLTNEHCIDCQPICRAVGRTLNFIQFVLGSLWFMFTIPIAEVSLPIVISDSVGQEYQGLVMSITVASTELLQGITPLWLSAAYETAQKRTFLPLLILTATFLPFLFGLFVVYLINKHYQKKDDYNTQEDKSRHSSQETSKLLDPVSSSTSDGQ